MLHYEFMTTCYIERSVAFVLINSSESVDFLLWTSSLIANTSACSRVFMYAKSRMVNRHGHSPKRGDTRSRNLYKKVAPETSTEFSESFLYYQKLSTQPTNQTAQFWSRASVQVSCTHAQVSSACVTKTPVSNGSTIKLLSNAFIHHRPKQQSAGTQKY